MKSLCQSICTLSFILFFSACCNLTGPIKTASSPDGQSSEDLASDILLNIYKTNDRIHSFKCLGDIMILKEGQVLQSRIAICGTRDGSLRIVTLIAGQPDETFATDGKTVYILSHTNVHPFIKKKVSPKSLKKILAIQIKIDDVIDLLTGRIPIYPHTSAIFQEKGEANDHILVLKKRWQGIVEKIYMDKNKTNPAGLEIFDPSGNLIYRAEFDEFETINGYAIPLNIIISDNDTVIKLNINKYLPDAPVSADMFVLYAPGKDIRLND